jgi:hypothetical protein
MEKSICGLCKFFDDELRHFQYRAVGYCLRNAPSPMVLHLNNETADDIDPTFIYPYWPVVIGDSHWCGEFERAIDTGE